MLGRKCSGIMMHSYDLHFFSLSYPLGFHVCQPGRNLDFFLIAPWTRLNSEFLPSDLGPLCFTDQVCLQQPVVSPAH